MNFRKLFHAHTAKMQSPNPTSSLPTSQKLFYRPGTIEEMEEEHDIYDELKFKTEKHQSLYGHCKNLLSPSAPNLQRIHTNSSLTKLSGAPSLTRLSTANSSLYQAPGTIKQDSIR